MIDIITLKGERWSYDPETTRIFKDDKLVPSTEAEPIFADSTGDEPEFSGIYVKTKNQIVSRTGKINTISDPNTIA